MTRYYPGTQIPIRTVPSQDGQKRRGRWRKGRRFANAEQVIASGLDRFVDDRTGSDVNPDTRENMDADHFPESDQDLEATGTEFVTTDLDGEFVSYLK